MTAATSPYTTADTVAYLMQVSLKSGTSFSDATNPSLNMVNTFIGWISSQIDLQFSMAGYILPLSELSGETWPTSQTTYLQLVATLGTVAMAGGYAQKPLPTIAPSRSTSSGNVFQDLFNAELAKIYDQRSNKTYLNFRALYRIGSVAQVALTDPRGPSSDFMEGYFDPMTYYDLWDMAHKVSAIQCALSSMDISWDYMFGLLNRGFGTAPYESIADNPYRLMR